MRPLSLRSLPRTAAFPARSIALTRTASTPAMSHSSSSVGPLYAAQRTLPHLPVPPLTQTAERYLESVRPHLSDAEYATTSKAVQDFVQGPGPELQKRLEERAKTEENWLSKWWNETAYMGYRDPVIPYVNYFFLHADQPTLPQTQAGRGAALIKAVLAFRDLVESQQLEPEKVKETPLCSASYKWMFNSARHPVKPSDTATKYDPSKNQHITVIRKNRFYEVDVSKGGIEGQLKRVVALADAAGPAPPVGVLTTENRDIWADARAHLAQRPENAKALERIDSSIIVLSLDDTAPVTREEASWGSWSGGGRNRWFDKHQLIVFENGKSAFNGEHSCMDGTPLLRLNEFLLASLSKGKIPVDPPTNSYSSEPVELKFALDEGALEYIRAAETHHDEVMGKHSLQVLNYEGYGSGLIKQFKASPDAWAQLVKQLAFYKLKGRPPAVYESCQTRRFALGRTEVIRSTSNESTAFVKAMLDPKASDAERVEKFRAAVKRHLTYAGWAASGEGVDRHLYGLKKSLKEDEPVPAIYTDPAFGRSANWELSTSQLSSPWFDGWGYGEVVPEGFGLAYAIHDRSIRWTITCTTGEGDRLRHYLAESATELRNVMERAQAAEKAKL